MIEARHIAESDEAAMSRHGGGDGRVRSGRPEGARRAEGPAPGRRSADLAAAAAALDRFTAVNAEIVTLSRRNSNVRSLALSLGRKRTVTAECDDMLQALDDALAKHHFAATR